ncbi:MAG: acetamidase/formamidase family protein [Coriobacteriales bacterium]|nr:acetamidase/formamidase family protein [Coriobacteriales bacterium]
MKVISDQVYKFSKDNKPCETILPGEVVKFKALDCFSNTITNESITMQSTDFSYDVANPAAGPVFVQGAEPGDVLVVDVYDVQVADHGVIATDDHCGPLFEGTDYRSKIIQITDGMADFNGIKIAINPMVGVMGTAPDGDDVIDGYVGDHGGNMDCKLITKGSRLYFPVRVPGALLQMGDVHAIMGDGELCGTGLEIPADITVKTSIIKDFKLNWPVLETDDYWYVIACGQEYNDVVTNVCKEMRRLIMGITGWDAVETYMFMSVRCDLEVNQGCKPCAVPMVLRLGFPKDAQFAPLVS